VGFKMLMTSLGGQREWGCSPSTFYGSKECSQPIGVDKGWDVSQQYHVACLGTLQGRVFVGGLRLGPYLKVKN